MFESVSNYLQVAGIYSFTTISILIMVGFIVGFINTVAGSATAITYMLFMAMGLPITEANATSRIGVFLQFSTSSMMFKKKGYLNISEGNKIGIPIVIGSIFGAIVASVINQQIFEVVLAFFLCIMLFFMFYDAQRFLVGNEEKRCEKFTFSKWILFVFVGFYGGFTHIGVGILILFGSALTIGLNLLQANAVKQYAVMLYTPFALLVFAISGQVHWRIGLIYAVGNVLGAFIATKTAIKWGANFIRWSVAAIIVFFVVQLILKQI